ncbi:Nicotinamide nucleotide repair protein [Neisseria animaloris]|uniref:NAD(P)H-hydrate epimerase n=1 Tax=Neisseria animaloris TaxID=326522 RepID=UPI000A1988D2|nr:NAD(P)H-hydrate epimerase [Neisseria animaloris]OSI06770.1 NAD(P)H-hydrate epimerase [Neisseria animaloris]VEH86877.1 Nicotinamide nucleotide repair protein [Neisseria animaloris]
MKIYTAAEMRVHEQAAVDAGTSFEQLMENAGQGAAADLLQRRPQAGRALVVCGKGNNGGDGLVMARVLQRYGWRADVVFVLGENLSELAELNRRRLTDLAGIEFIGTESMEGRLKTGYDVIIEGIFGTGFTGKLPDTVAAVCRRLNLSDGLKVALDIPTGLNGDTAEADADTFQADITYTFAAYKPAHLTESGKKFCGEIVCLDIGID